MVVYIELFDEAGSGMRKCFARVLDEVGGNKLHFPSSTTGLDTLRRLPWLAGQLWLGHIDITQFRELGPVVSRCRRPERGVVQDPDIVECWVDGSGLLPRQGDGKAVKEIGQPVPQVFRYVG